MIYCPMCHNELRDCTCASRSEAKPNAAIDTAALRELYEWLTHDSEIRNDRIVIRWADALARALEQT